MGTNGVSKQKQYWESQRAAKRLGGEYKRYVDNYYKVSKQLRSHKVVLKDIGTKTQILTPEQFNVRLKTGISIKDMVNKQFGLMSKSNAEALQKTVKAELGYKMSLTRARARQLKPAEWDVVKKAYRQLQSEGYTPQEAGFEISSYFFGS